MSLAAGSTFEVRTGGNDTNGGGFVPGAAGTDYSLQDSKNTVGSDISTTDAVAAGSTTITSVLGNFGTSIVGNVIYLQGGSGSLAAGWYQVTARASTTSITVDRTVAVGTGITMNIGGALATPGGAFAVGLSNSYVVYIKSGTYSITSAGVNVANGCMSGNSVVTLIGYNTTRTPTNTDTKPIIQSNVSTATVVAGGAVGPFFVNIAFDGNSQTAAKATVQAYFYRCTFTGYNTASTGSPVFVYCSCTANSAAPFSGGLCYFCEGYANTTCPFPSVIASWCIASANTGATTDGFNQGNTPNSLFGCVAYSNGRDGYRCTGTNAIVLVNCIAESNTGIGFNYTGNAPAKGLINCAVFGNGTNTVMPAVIVLSTALTTAVSSVFTNPGSGDFSLNNTAGAGAALRAAGFPATFPRALTNNYMDIGAIQHPNPTIAGAVLIGQGIARAGIY